MIKKITKINTLLMIFSLLVSLNSMAQMELTEEIKHNYLKKKTGRRTLNGGDICGLKILNFGPVKKTAKGYSSDFFANSMERIHLFGIVKKNTTESECNEAIKKIKSMKLKGKIEKQGTMNWQ